MIDLSTANIGDKFLTRDGKALTYIGKAYFYEKTSREYFELYPTEMYNPMKSFKYATHIINYLKNGEVAHKEFAKTCSQPYDASYLDLVKALS